MTEMALSAAKWKQIIIYILKASVAFNIMPMPLSLVNNARLKERRKAVYCSMDTTSNSLPHSGWVTISWP